MQILHKSISCEEITANASTMKCYICNKIISGSYYTDVWEHMVCAEHFNSGEISRCSSCSGFTVTDKRYTLVDKRVLCSACKNNVIDSDDEVDLIKYDILHNLYKYGFADLLMDSVTIEVVTASRMAQIRGGEINILNRGLTLSQVKNSYSIFGISKMMYHKIYMLECLPKIEFAGTLAHELIHAWQVQNGINPPAMWCEGLCNLATYYTYTMMPSPLTKIFKKNLMDNPDPIYGGGFRAVLKLESEIGINGIIDKYKQEYKRT